MSDTMSTVSVPDAAADPGIEALRRREEQYRALAQTVPVGIWQVEEGGTTSFANPLLLAYLGLDIDDVAHADVAALLGGGRSNFPGESSRFEIDLVAATGQTRRVLVIGSGWLALSGSSTRSAIVSVVDISEMAELKRVNDEISRLNRELAGNMRQLKEAQEELLKRGRMAQLGHLTATVAHEIRNPLGAVRTAAFLLERKLKDKGLGVEAQIQRINNGITRCDDIITQLLDFSRSRALQLEALVIDDWLASLLDDQARSLPAAISIECALGLGTMTALIDPGRLSRAIINLLANASEAMVGKGDDPAKFTSTDPRLFITTALTARGIEISVRDTGPGMAPDVAKRILEPLFTTKNFGTGLGLPAVEKIVQEHGGGLAFESAPGAGATFTVWFPVRTEAPQAVVAG